VKAPTITLFRKETALAAWVAALSKSAAAEHRFAVQAALLTFSRTAAACAVSGTTS
jgi:hypothetical protein